LSLVLWFAITPSTEKDAAWEGGGTPSPVFWKC
jgi:hypothetical protein